MGVNGEWIKGRNGVSGDGRGEVKLEEKDKRI